MFKANKYTKWYYSIVTNPDKNATYIENHHIIPSSMGGSDAPENLVGLSARQHFVAHLLLTKMTEGSYRDKAISAIRQMRRASKGQERYVPSSRIFEIIRKLMSVQQKERAIKMWKDPEFRKRHKEATDKSNAAAGVTERRRAAALKADSNPITRERKRLAALNRPKHSEETILKMQDAFIRRHGKLPKRMNMTHPLSPNWRVISPDGEITLLYDLKNFCLQNKLHQPSLTYTVKTGLPLPPMQRKRFDTSEERKSTIGWMAEKLFKLDFTWRKSTKILASIWIFC